jgi:hypothetical protein
MKNSSGCRVAVRGIGKVTGTRGHVYATNPPGGSQSLGSRTDGFSFHDTRSPFGQALAPNTQEYPASCEIDNIEACSATAPPNFPAATSFRPFLDGKCTKLSNVGPVALSQVAKKACGSSQNGTMLDWADSWVHQGHAQLRPEERWVKVLDSGILAHKDDSGKRVDETTILFSSISQVRVVPYDGNPALWKLQILPTQDGTFPEHESEGYNNGDYQSHQFQFVFDSRDAAQQAHDYFEYHLCVGK